MTPQQEEALVKWAWEVSIAVNAALKDPEISASIGMKAFDLCMAFGFTNKPVGHQAPTRPAKDEPSD